VIFDLFSLLGVYHLIIDLNTVWLLPTETVLGILPGSVKNMAYALPLNAKTFTTDGDHYDSIFHGKIERGHVGCTF